jgi:uncharacterized iron-regulated membrane protein
MPVENANVAPLEASDEIVPPTSVLRKLAGRGRVDRLEFVGTPHGPVYRCKVGDSRARFDAHTGNEIAVDEAEAIAVARRDQPGAPLARSVVRIEHDADVEYRGKPLPAWRVTLADDGGTVVYVDALTAEVTARRNHVWRIYDFLWSLHIMDYREHETFKHPLLIVAASLGVLTVLSGAVLWGVRSVRWARRKRTRGRGAGGSKSRAERPAGADSSG